MVCHGLDKLEEKVPAIKKSPDELKTAGWGTYEAIRSYGTQRLDSIKDYVTSQVEKASSTAYAQAVLKTVDTAVDLTDHAIDMYLPPSEEEKENEGDGDKVNGGPHANDDSTEQNFEKLALKVTHLSGKVRRRLPRYDLVSPWNWTVRNQITGSAPTVSSN